MASNLLEESLEVIAYINAATAAEPLFDLSNRLGRSLQLFQEYEQGVSEQTFETRRWPTPVACSDVDERDNCGGTTAVY
jgi:hypothetical protein